VSGRSVSQTQKFGLALLPLWRIYRFSIYGDGATHAMMMQPSGLSLHAAVWQLGILVVAMVLVDPVALAYVGVVGMRSRVQTRVTITCSAVQHEGGLQDLQELLFHTLPGRFVVYAYAHIRSCEQQLLCSMMCALLMLLCFCNPLYCCAADADYWSKPWTACVTVGELARCNMYHKLFDSVLQPTRDA
jgi:hypothetical protein